MSLHTSRRPVRLVVYETNATHPVLFIASLIVLIAMAASAEAEITYSPFGSRGEGGEVNDQSLLFGNGGSVYELQGFVNVAGRDLNGGEIGTSAQLAANPLPAGLSLEFAAALSGDRGDLMLTYTFANNSSAVFPQLWFGLFVDADIDSEFYDSEAGSTLGSLGGGTGGPQPDAWEIDEPGYVFGDIWDHLLLRSLDNTNSVTSHAPDDVSMALAFELGDLLPGQLVRVTAMLSDQEHLLGSFALRQFDPFGDSADTLTFSGAAFVVPEPGSLPLAAMGLLGLGMTRKGVNRRRRKHGQDRII
jgi:hypothetical protein